jgi:hypothetical protein
MSVRILGYKPACLWDKIKGISSSLNSVFGNLENFLSREAVKFVREDSCVTERFSPPC